MEKKSILLYGGIVITGLMVMVGVIFYLRARNAPAETDALVQPIAGSVGRATVMSTSTRGRAGVPPYTPLDKTPVAPPFTAADEAKLNTKLYPSVDDTTATRP